ncbi:NNP family nitrate/nitrite transporter-like MFS transporter [Thermosporothrix hazakensis]|jgi:NNP family nitrate/nitrite transporter-like MFS transporter|uniref:NNP family nitrate/nitrite transporter-like MFS transporter n=1 Tax=Thermosporothrix hazakensis TaxID=644383 RepID=A0A326UNP2_THEHA|nr:MFS transporter [Thermosporothrix hazakensis]PZW31922.1 NNP family nitrate/nitrite transporter-like MFS transporter [Thermosporothrix hazakensis]GCE49753.1 nitrite extrusion protein [Thermosporothrix hazakensis]
MQSRRAIVTLIMATIAFTVSFAVFSLISPFAPQLQKLYNLNDFEISILIALPSLLGSVLRVPAGALTDRFGGRKVMTGLLIFSCVPVLGMMSARTYLAFVCWGLLLGVVGTSFAVGAPYVSRWFPSERQGLVLGIFGVGNIGTAITVNLAPRLAHLLGSWESVFLLFAALSLLTALVYYQTAHDELLPSVTASMKERLALLWREKPAWVLSLLYFVTFGGLVAFSLYLPKLLVDLHMLDKVEAGNYAAIFVCVGTLVRPFGGWLSDRVGAWSILLTTFGGLLLLACVLIFHLPLMYLNACLICIAICLGVGSGAVFKLVPLYYAKDAGVVSGLVGAAGGLGGFFPPLIMGFCKEIWDTYIPGYILLALVTLCCLLLIFYRGQVFDEAERVRMAPLVDKNGP